MSQLALAFGMLLCSWVGNRTLESLCTFNDNRNNRRYKRSMREHQTGNSILTFKESQGKRLVKFQLWMKR